LVLNPPIKDLSIPRQRPKIPPSIFRNFMSAFRIADCPLACDLLLPLPLPLLLWLSFPNGNCVRSRHKPPKTPAKNLCQPPKNPLLTVFCG
jgi:hypothetical protein